MTDYTAVIEQLKNAKVLCFGDIMLDTFAYGEVSRISPEAPVPVLKVSDKRSMLGGVGNVARNLCELGIHSTLLSIVGKDEAGDSIKGLAAAMGAKPHLTPVKGRPTTLKTRFIATNQQVLRVDEETAEIAAAPDMEKVTAKFEKLVQQSDVVILSDYGKGIFTAKNVRGFIKKAQKAGCRVIVDPKMTDYGAYQGADLITPNRKELEAATGGQPLKDQAAVQQAAKALIKAHDIKAILVTLSAEGMMLVRAGKPSLHIPAKAREVYDVSGAGDTVVALMAAAWAVGLDDQTAMDLANAAASVVVGKLGTATTTQTELQAALLDLNQRSGRRKIMELDEGLEKIAAWRKNGNKIGFTNGCFDLIHPGHVTLLAEARATCDKLILGLNSDASIKRIKGPKRPIQSEDSRALVLASFENVDMVILFGEDTPIDLIKTLQPDVLVKGSDYKVEEVVGHDVVAKYGGKVHLVQLVDGHSTTGITHRMAS